MQTRLHALLNVQGNHRGQKKPMTSESIRIRESINNRESISVRQEAFTDRVSEDAREFKTNEFLIYFYMCIILSELEYFYAKHILSLSLISSESGHALAAQSIHQSQSSPLLFTGIYSKHFVFCWKGFQGNFCHGSEEA
jgi:hypothetical protein